MNNIPKIIHQTWKSKDIPHDIYKKEWAQSWRDFHPDWVYKLWTDEDNRNLIKEHYPEFLGVYDNYPKGINRADAARYFILYHYGGLYVDLDFECLKNFEPVLKDHDLVLGRMNSGLFIRHCIPNALMASTKNNPFWKSVIKALPGRRSMRCVELATGPAMLFTVFVSWQLKRWIKRILLFSRDGQRVKLYDPGYFYPVSWEKMSIYHQQINEALSLNLKYAYPESYAITYWCHQWQDFE